MAKLRLCSLITRSLPRDRCCLPLTCSSSPTCRFELEEKWALGGLAKLLLTCLGAEVLAALWGEAVEGFTAPLQCYHGLVGNFSDPLLSPQPELCSRLWIFLNKKIVASFIPLIAPKKIFSLPPFPALLCSPLPALNSHPAPPAPAPPHTHPNQQLPSEPPQNIA